MNYPIFARKGGATPSVTEEQAERALSFGKRRIINLNGFTRQDTLSRDYADHEFGESVAVEDPAHEPENPAACGNERRKFSLRLDPDLHRRFRRAVAARKISGQKLLEGLLRDYLEGFEISAEEADNGQS